MSPEQFLELVNTTAKDEIEFERYRKAVEQEKTRIRAAKWWHRFIPIITIKWRK